MALSGNTLPQISTSGASVSGTFHIVTSDGAGPLTAYVDATGKGDFSSQITGTMTTQVPGSGGNIQKTTKRWEGLMIRAGLKKRATNINEDFVSIIHHSRFWTLVLTSQLAIQSRYPRRNCL